MVYYVWERELAEIRAIMNVFDGKKEKMNIPEEKINGGELKY
jgi:hypothetical protein